AVGPRTCRAKTGADGRINLRMAKGGTFEFFAVRTTGPSVISSFDGADPVVETWRAARRLGRREHDATGDVEFGDVVLAAGKPLAGRVVDSAGASSSGAQASLFLGELCVGRVL